MIGACALIAGLAFWRDLADSAERLRRAAPSPETMLVVADPAGPAANVLQSSDERASVKSAPAERAPVTAPRMVHVVSTPAASAVEKDPFQDSASSPAVLALGIAPLRPVEIDMRRSAAGRNEAAVTANPVGTNPVAANIATKVEPADSRAVPAGFDPDQTSWELPFDAECWEANGWEFSSTGMRSTTPGSSALFRRGYRRLMLECRLTPLDGTHGPLQLRLITSTPKSALLVHVDGSRLALLDEQTKPPRLIKAAKLDPPCTRENPGRLRLAATGNRVVLAWNGRIALSCDQPAAQSGHSAQFEFLVAKAPFEVTALRVEGE